MIRIRGNYLSEFKDSRKTLMICFQNKDDIRENKDKP